MTVKVIFNSGDNEWYTPERYIIAARNTMGSIDLDPASCAEANEVVKANGYFTKGDDGLRYPWFGNIWLNPPYGRKLVMQFAEKLTDEYCHFRVRQAVVLVNNATETKWFATLASEAAALCLHYSRIRFWQSGHERRTASGAEDRPLQGQAFFYFGDDRGVNRFAEEFAQFGSIWRMVTV